MIKRGLKICLFLAVIVLVSLGIVENVYAYNFTDDFSDSSKISSMNRLNLNTNITLTNVMNDTNDTRYLLLLSHLGNDDEILNPVVGHAGNPYIAQSNYSDNNHYDYDSAMVGWWNFTTDANDSSGNNNHGTVIGATHVGEHYEFNGTTDYIDLGSDTSLENFSSKSVFVWFKADGYSGTHRYIMDGNYYNSPYGDYIFLDDDSNEVKLGVCLSNNCTVFNGMV